MSTLTLNDLEALRKGRNPTTVGPLKGIPLTGLDTPSDDVEAWLDKQMQVMGYPPGYTKRAATEDGVTTAEATARLALINARLSGAQLDTEIRTKLVALAAATISAIPEARMKKAQAEALIAGYHELNDQIEKAERIRKTPEWLAAKAKLDKKQQLTAEEARLIQQGDISTIAKERIADVQKKLYDAELSKINATAKGRKVLKGLHDLGLIKDPEKIDPDELNAAIKSDKIYQLIGKDLNHADIQEFAQTVRALGDARASAVKADVDANAAKFDTVEMGEILKKDPNKLTGAEATKLAAYAETLARIDNTKASTYKTMLDAYLTRIGINIIEQALGKHGEHLGDLTRVANLKGMDLGKIPDAPQDIGNMNITLPKASGGVSLVPRK